MTHDPTTLDAMIDALYEGNPCTDTNRLRRAPVAALADGLVLPNAATLVDMVHHGRRCSMCARTYRRLMVLAKELEHATTEN